MRQLKVFIAGPFSAYGSDHHDALRITSQNIRRAIECAMVVLERGHWPFIPHLTYYFHVEQDHDLGDLYYEWDNAYLDVCEALVQFAPSPGADNERKRAMDNGAWVCRDPHDLPRAEDLPDDLVPKSMGIDNARLLWGPN